MSPGPQSLTAAVAAAAAAVRRQARAAIAALALVAGALVLLASWLLASAWARPSPVPLVVDGLLLLAGAALLLYWRRVLRPRLDAMGVAAAAERRHGLQAGSLRGLLELDGHVPAGTSVALARREARVLAQRLAGRSARELSGDLGEAWAGRARRWGGVAAAAALALAVLGFASPDRSRTGWTPLLHPVRQLSRPPLPPLELSPGHTVVQRGAPLAVRLVAPGREAVLLRWRLEGDVVREQPLAVHADSASGHVPAIAAAGEYWVVAPDGATTPRYRIMVTDALLLEQLAVDVLYPAYLGLSPERYEGDVPLLEIPAGTTLRVRGRATRELVLAALQGGGGAVTFRTAGPAFEGRWTPRESGLYRWSLRGAGSAGAVVAPAPVEVVVIPDRPPVVELTFPGADTVLGADLRQAVAAEGRDDHALAGAALVSWRAGADGQRDAPVEAALPLGGGGEVVLLRGVLDATARGLVPGDTLRYFVRVVDGAGQSAVSATLSLRLPGAAELRARAAEAARDALEQGEAAARAAAEGERQTRAASRSAQAANARRAASEGGGGDPGRQQGGRMAFRETEAARRVVERQAALSRQLEQLRAAAESLDESAAAAGLRDAELQRRLAELNQLLERLQAPALQRELEALQQSLQALSPEAMEQALERLAAEQQQLQAQLERALEQLRRAEAEQELNALSQEAKELAAQQEALAQEHERAPGGAEAGRRAEQQAELSGQGERLGEALERLGGKLAQQGAEQPAERTADAAERAREAHGQMEQAAAAAAERRPADAAAQGRQAAAQLRQAAAELEAARQGVADQERQRAEAELQQATRDALALAQRQHELQLEMERGQAQPQPAQGQRPGAPETPRPPQPGSGRSEQDRTSQQPGQRQGQEQGSQRGGQRPSEGGGGQPGQEQGGAQGGGARGGSAGQPQPDVAPLLAEQQALQQGLEQLGRNLAETGQQSGMVSQETGSSLNRAHTAMERTQEGLQQAEHTGQLPAAQAAQAVDALNRLALSLLQNAQQLQQVQNGGGTAGALEQLAELARQQSSVNGQSSALQPLGLSPGSAGEQARRLGQEQQQIARQLAGMSSLLGGREDVMGEVDALAREAEALARELRGGRLAPEVRARQERLFHRLLDAGRSLEQEETSEARSGERPGAFDAAAPGALDPRLLEPAERYRLPGAEELRSLPPAYRRLILDYFERLNRLAPPAGGGR